MKLYDDMGVDFRSIVERLTGSMKASGLVTDTHTGSVTTLLAESFAREMAVFYAVLEKAHEAGFLESARGKALESVVALLGVKRAAGDLLRGEVTFQRTTPAPQDIGIPVGTRVTGPAANGQVLPVVETVTPARIRSGRRSVSITVQEVPGDDPAPACDALSANSLTLLPRPLMGVETVTNPEPITRNAKEENDDQLRARAAAALRQGQAGTVEAIEAAVRRFGIETVKVVESPRGISGSIEIHLQDAQLQQKPERESALRQTVRNVKPAGIHVALKFLRPVYCQPIVTVTLADEEMADDDFEPIAAQIREKIAAFIDATPSGTRVAEAKLSAIVESDPAVAKVAPIQMKTVAIAYGPDGTERLRWKKDGWQIHALENPTVDPDRWPVRIVRLLPLKASMNLAVTLPEGEVDEVRKKVRDIAEAYIQENTITSLAVDFNLLSKWLTHGIQGAALHPTWIVHQSDGTVEDLTPDHAASLANGEQLTVNDIDVFIEEVKSDE